MVSHPHHPHCPQPFLPSLPSSTSPGLTHPLFSSAPPPSLPAASQKMRGGSLAVAFLMGALTLICFLGVVVLHLPPSDPSYLLRQPTAPKAMTSSTTTSISTPIRQQVSPFPFDIVTLVHHSDMNVFLDFAVQSWKANFISSRRVFAICDPEAFLALTTQISSPSTDPVFKQFVVPVDQALFPFTLEDVKNSYAAKPTWLYQQLLKLYSYQIISSIPKLQPISQQFLVIDSDTVATRSTTFFASTDNTLLPLYSIASGSTGAFPTDDEIGGKLIREVFPTLSKAFPDYKTRSFTSITHHMVFDGPILIDMLSNIETNSNKPKTPAWEILSSLKYSILSEWELYMAWIMAHHRASIGVRPLPYVNWGKLSADTLKMLKDDTDIVYLTKHDDYSEDNICCVNSVWNGNGCKCCPARNNGNGPDECERVAINCEVLGIEGCQNVQDKITGLEIMMFG